MITAEKSDNIFNASEDIVLVPVPINDTRVHEGFAAQVFARFPFVESTFKEKDGLVAGETLIVGQSESPQTGATAYSLALCAIHRRTGRGWEGADWHLETSLDYIARTAMRGGHVTVATAGIPGTGYSGLVGNASPDRMKKTLQSHALHISVYRDGDANDRAAVEITDPELLTKK